MRAALYVTWSPVSHASSMVLRQIATLADCGYKVLVISNSPTWDATLSENAFATMHRPHNIGQDFGAWRQAFEEWPGLVNMDEVLLVNDSVLGPVAPLAPILARMQGRPAEVMGMTDSRMYVEHLQSYFLMFKTPRSVDALATFLYNRPPLPDKASVVQHGELALYGHLRQRGITAGAEFGYETVLDWTAAHMPEWCNAVCRPRPGEDWEKQVRERLRRHAFNPTHFFWLPLLRLGFPFVKRDLLLKNPGFVPGVSNWKTWLDGHVEEIENHLSLWSDP